MTRRKIFLIAILTLTVVFFLSFVWEFVFVDFILGSFNQGLPEPNRSHWEFIVTSTAFAAIAVGISSMVSVKIVTERQEVEKELEDQFNLQQALIDSIPAPVFYKDMGGVYLRCNTAFESFIGLTKENIIGKNAYDVAPKDLADIYQAADTELLEIGGAQIYEAACRHASGKLRDVVYHKAVFYKSNGDPGGLVGAMMDITGRKRIESALRESELKFKVFASDAAHELRTPLSAIKLKLNELESGENSQSLLKTVNEMSRTLEQLLALARLDSSETLEMSKIDLREICAGVAERLGPLAIEHDRSIEIVGTEGPILIDGNADALDHAVRNLIENALKYSARKTTITIQVSDAPSISVINKGQGIPKEKRGSIFKRFQRSDRRSDGAGLGLSIVKRVVEAHEGEIIVTDIPDGDGVNFTITL